jgi:hypothetical protein
VNTKFNVILIQVDIWSILADVSIGTWLGFVVTLVASFGVLRVRRERRKTKLRRALVAELEQQDLDRVVSAVNASEAAVPPGESNGNLDLDPSELPPAGTLPIHIYTSNTGNLGILSEDEVTDTVSYYSTLLTQKAIIQAIRSGDGAVAADQKELRDTLPGLENDRSDLVETLRDAEQHPERLRIEDKLPYQ